MDVDGGLPANGNPVPQILNNVFLGGGDDALDLEGDFVIEGNIFTHFHKDSYAYHTTATARPTSSRPATRHLSATTTRRPQRVLRRRPRVLVKDNSS